MSTDEIVNLFAKIEELKQHVPLVGQIFTLSNMFFLTTFLSISFFRETESTYIIVSYFRITQRLIFQHNMVTTVVPRVVAQLYYIFMFSCLHSVKVSFTLFSFLMQYNFITSMRLPSNNKIQETTLV